MAPQQVVSTVALLVDYWVGVMVVHSVDSAGCSVVAMVVHSVYSRVACWGELRVVLRVVPEVVRLD